MPVASVVADANVLLSAVTGRAALRVFAKYEVAIHVGQFNVDEVLEYIPEMAAKHGLPAELVEMQWKLLPVAVHAFDEYRGHFDQALADLANRDPEGAHALALARRLRVPLWSNDRDLHGLGVECFSTARLLAVLKRERETDT